MSGNWFADRLAQQGHGPPVSSGPPQLPAMPPVAPNGLRLPQPQPQPVAAPVAAPQQQQQITGKENFQALVQDKQSRGEHVTFTGLSRSWKGGEAMQTEGHITCPSCGGSHLFTRSNVRIMNESGVSGHARPRCFDCGWSEDPTTGSTYTPGAKGNWS